MARRHWIVVYLVAFWALYLLSYAYFVRGLSGGPRSEVAANTPTPTAAPPRVHTSIVVVVTAAPTTTPVPTTAAPPMTLPPPLTMAPVATISLVIFTTMKPCHGRLVHTQYNAVMSWRRLPLSPTPIVLIFGGGSDIAGIAERAGAVHIPKEAIDPVSGTALLGRMIRYAQHTYPNADVYGFANADIVFPRYAADAFRLVSSLFTKFFLIGHRFGVNVESDLPFSDTEWDLTYIKSAFYHGTATLDRKDAEDYFFWSAGFLADGEVPDFHIGRPAYDNWFVHHAIHTDMPVIDGTELLLPLHQSHDYSHLKKNDTTKYWGSVEQQKNYDLALAHGGWQHGLVEFSPFRISPPRCALRGPGYCKVYFRRGWRPLRDDRDLMATQNMYSKFVRQGQGTAYGAAMYEPVVK